MSNQGRVVVRVDRGVLAQVQADAALKSELDRAVRVLEADPAPEHSTAMVRDGSCRSLPVERFAFVYDVRGGGTELEIFAIVDRTKLRPGR